MKSVVKHIAISIVLTYFVITIISIGYYNDKTKNEVKDLQIVSNGENSQMHEETINLNSDLTLQKLLKMNYLNGKMNILSIMIEALVISIAIGILIGLIISVKEHSKVRYILLFILGNVLYNGIVTVIIKIVYAKTDLSLTIGEAYRESFQKTILIYCLFFLVFLGLKCLNNKIKVNKLNEELKSKKD